MPSTLWAFDRNPPFVSNVLRANVPYPLSAANAAAPPLTPAPDTPLSITAIDPNLRLPYTWQWNAAVAQSLGRHQTLTVTYVGAAGRNLLQRQYFAQFPGLPSIAGGLTTSDGTSTYRALQVKFDRRMSHGLQAVASYSWAHAQDAQSDDINFSRGSASVGRRRLRRPPQPRRGPDLRPAQPTSSGADTAVEQLGD